ncbi:MAG: hypothetical protein KU37_08090 [Sulfuricurvum sp. PC08-66]|nr:MAG: hypothetical protein KU37_08090 [Sulfuricurvum sp. PC08-66]
MQFNKSYLTNAIAATLVAVGATESFAGAHSLLLIGLFALSGSLTNTIAIHMLFHRVPLFYGSGVILIKFAALKSAIADLVMRQFFSVEHLERFLPQAQKGIDIAPLIEQMDLSIAFAKLVEVIMGSTFGGMLGMFGGEKVLHSFKEPFETKMRQALLEMAADPALQAKLQAHLFSPHALEEAIEKIEHLVLARLDELTPEMVREMIESIIHEHLGWLVVWGGVFGGIIGAVSVLWL